MRLGQGSYYCETSGARRATDKVPVSFLFGRQTALQPTFAPRSGRNRSLEDVRQGIPNWTMDKCLHVIYGNKEGDKRARGGRGVRKNVQEEAPQQLVLLYDKSFWVLWILVRLGRDRTRKGGEDRSFRFCVGRDGSGERGGGAKVQREKDEP